MLKEHPSKRLIISTIAAASILSFSGAGATWAFVTSAHETVTNSFSVLECKASIVEDFDQPDSIEPGSRTKKDVRVRNEGGSSCYVRALVEFESESCKDWASIRYSENDWSLEDDGYRYYERILEPGETSPPICTEVAVSPDANPAQIESFNVIALCEATPIKDEEGSAYENAQEAFAEGGRER